MQFGVLGPLQLRSATGDEVAVSGPRPRALLVLLLLDAGRVVSIDQLIAGQYGDDPPAGATNALQAQVSRLRRDLPDGLVEFHGSGYRLAVDPDDVDVHRFERLVREGHRLLAAGAHAKAVTTLHEALDLWRGQPLADLPNAEAQATRLEEARLAAREDLVEAELALPEGTNVAELRRLVDEHPLRERLRGQLMRALQQAGRQAEALEEYEAARRLLADELGVDPSPELAAIHLAILRAEGAAKPTRRALPAQLTTFVGRDAELERLADLPRLVTLVGPGGTGKTRLAIEVARRDGREVCFADLAPLHDDDEDQLAATVLAALGLREAGFQPAGVEPVRRLAAALDDNLLLVLDNCEQVIAAAAGIVRTLLDECPDLHVIATSREPLGLTGETLLPLEPLAADNAVRLFEDRAAAVRPGYAPGQHHAEVAQLCAALDGLPLAIELAAARLREFDVHELATRLDEHGRFRLLSRGDRTAAARHQTLTAVIEWSWDLLTNEQRQLASRFAVFAGGASLAAVEAVCDVPDADVLLADLVDKSIVRSDGSRYEMLETIRLFCAERLTEEVRRAHARYYLSLAQQADPYLRRAEQLDWLATLTAEHDNLMTALRYAATHDQETETGYRMVAALAAYLWLSGRRSQAGAAAATLLEHEPEDLDEEYVACVVHAIPTAAPEHWERAKAIMRSFDRPLEHPFGAAIWGMTAGPPDEDDAETPALLGSDPWNAALGRLSTALFQLLDGRPAAGERELVEVAATFQSLGERWGSAQALDFLAQAAGWRGEWQRAHGYWATALRAFEELGALEECADLLCHRGNAFLRQGELDAATEDFARAAEFSVKAGSGIPPAVPLGLANVARCRDDPEAVRERLAEASAAVEAGSFRFASMRAQVFTALGRHAEAVAAARTSPFAADVADATEGLAGEVVAAGEGDRAALLLGVAVALRGTAVAGDPQVARVTEEARGLIGAGAFAVAYARGAELDKERALTVVDGSTR
ncbi:BTAD domain-containing putative transcriptional regulator [Tenggerimyces flavus]|uniref:BTAD domain-containing putative transcriptional regulator n=1 Tax=Tenggerimyces flavus TaxID=1708749 RepID=A0ABV7Y6B6_9ACTN|nr:BTAD domain-containing putative transcriptional regulator [Tenggerimyces flavus]MBM7785214.1 putative ATPase/DNA-binding winged helix-turn-helix (wHTH) protein [Tenggerimyces flavus]